MIPRNPSVALDLTAALDRLWRDPRFTSRNMAVREFLTALLIAGATVPRDERWATVRDRLNPAGTRMPHGAWWRSIIRRDLPRYEPDSWDASCPTVLAAGPRRGEPCGKRPVTTHRVTDPHTGTWQLTGYCRAHYRFAAPDHARQVKIAQAAPTPHPNTGGLMPCYVRASNWTDVYRSASPPSWEPPTIGVCADDWPVLALTTPTGPPSLRIVTETDPETGTASARADASAPATTSPPRLILISDDTPTST